MHINLSPQMRDAPLVASKAGDVLTIDGIAYDFTPLGEGDILPREAVGCPLLVSDVERIGGRITLKLILPHGYNASEATRFPVPIIDPPDGPLALPAYNEVPE